MEQRLYNTSSAEPVDKMKLLNSKNNRFGIASGALVRSHAAMTRSWPKAHRPRCAFCYSLNQMKNCSFCSCVTHRMHLVELLLAIIEQKQKSNGRNRKGLKNLVCTK